MNDGVEELLAEFVERRESGEDVSADAFVAAHPECAGELRRALNALDSAEELFPTRPGDLPRRIGHYRVLSELGRGGMAQVLRVVRVDAPEVELALKRLDPLLELDPRALERFRREAQVLRTIDHPGVVRILEAGLWRGRPFLVMPLVEGENLSASIARARGRPRGDD